MKRKLNQNATLSGLFYLLFATKHVKRKEETHRERESRHSLEQHMCIECARIWPHHEIKYGPRAR